MENPKIFFSYSREDGEFVLALAKKLRAEGVYLWLDQLDIKPGELWDQSVEKALDSCECLILVLSPSSVESLNVMDEVSFALENGKQVVPVLKEKCKIPFRLRRVQHIDLSEDYEAGMATLLEALRRAGGDAEAGASEASAAGAAAPRRSSGLGRLVGVVAAAAAAVGLAGYFVGFDTLQGLGSSTTASDSTTVGDSPAASDSARAEDPAPQVVSVAPGAVPRAPSMVPRLQGKPEAEARQMLTAQALDLGAAKQECSSRVAEGHVIRTDPPAGTSSTPGQAVTLVVATGAWIWLDAKPAPGTIYRVKRDLRVREEPDKRGADTGETVAVGEKIKIVRSVGGWAQFLRTQ